MNRMYNWFGMFGLPVMLAAGIALSSTTVMADPLKPVPVVHVASNVQMPVHHTALAPSKPQSQQVVNIASSGSQQQSGAGAKTQVRSSSTQSRSRNHSARTERRQQSSSNRSQMSRRQRSQSRRESGIPAESQLIRGRIIDLSCYFAPHGTKVSDCGSRDLSKGMPVGLLVRGEGSARTGGQVYLLLSSQYNNISPSLAQFVGRSVQLRGRMEHMNGFPVFQVSQIVTPSSASSVR